MFTFLLIIHTSLRFSAHTLIMFFVNFCTFLLLYYWKLFALKLFMVFIVFQVFAHFCNIFFNTRTVFGVALLRLPYFKFVKFLICRKLLIHLVRNFWLQHISVLLIIRTFGASFGFSSLISGVFLPFHWYFSSFLSPLENLRGPIWGRPWHPSYVHTHTSSLCQYYCLYQ